MKIRRIMVVLGAAFALLGCGQEKKAEITEITLMHGWGGSLSTHTIMQEIYEEFSKENADIKLITYPSSVSDIAVEKANDMLAVGKMPDIVSTNGLSYFVSNAIKRNMALDLMPYIEGDERFKKQIHPAVLETWETEEHGLYTVPDALEIMGYWYNKEYFRQAGIEEVPGTWEEFFEDMELLKSWGAKRGTQFHPMALEKVQLTENLFLARLAGTKSGTAVTENQMDKVTEESMIQTLWDLEKLTGHAATVDNVNNARQSFADGKTALYFNGVWESDLLSLSSNKDDFGYAPYPTEEGESLAYISASSGYVLYDNPDEKKKEASIRFLKYMLSDSVQKKLALETGQAPSNPQVSGNEIKTAYPLLGEALDVAEQAKLHIRTISSLWDAGKLEVLSKNIMDMTAGRITPKEACLAIMP